MKTLVAAAGALFSCAAALYSIAGNDAPKAHKPGDFKVRVVAVSVADAVRGKAKAPRRPQSERIVVKPGELAVFHLEYDIPEDVKAMIFLQPNFDESKLGGNPFGCSGSAFMSGKGNASRILVLGQDGNAPHERELLVKSVRVTAELKNEEGGRRNDPFFICDAAVDVLFANPSGEDGSRATTLDPLPPPAPDPSLGIVKRDGAAKPASSTPPGFTDNLDEALAEAKASGRFVYACFSGSDWCGWCMKLEKEVFSDPAFASGVAKDYVLVFIDLPENTAVLSEHAKKANGGLVKKYAIRGFPTALVLDGDGRQIGKTGYREGGAAAYVEHLMSIRAANKR